MWKELPVIQFKATNPFLGMHSKSFVGSIQVTKNICRKEYAQFYEYK